MQKIIAKIAILALALASTMATVPAQAATTWDVTGTYEWVVLGTYHHDITLTQNPDGTFTGTGGYPAGADPYTTGESITEGLVDGDNIEFRTTYTGPGLTPYTVKVYGTIAPDGTISGTNPWAWQFINGFADNDSDNDGVLNGTDLCLGTGDEADWSEGLGPNRWKVVDGSWYQNKVKKGVPTPTLMYPLSHTYGCNGADILTMLNDTYGSVMNGHWKFGLSSSVLEEFHLDLADGVMDGMYLVDTVVVPANDADGVASAVSPLLGYNYVLKVIGTADAGDGIVFDADYSFRTPTSVMWTDAVSTYEYLGDTLLDLVVDNGFVNWDDDATYNTDHTYSLNYVGTGAPVTLMVNDAYYPNNTGSLTVDIYAQI